MPRFSDTLIREILVSREPHTRLAQRLGGHPSTYSLIRSGRIYAKSCPDVPRWQPGRTCSACCHWIDGDDARCDLGLPDPKEEGLGFARECLTFAARGS